MAIFGKLKKFGDFLFGDDEVDGKVDDTKPAEVVQKSEPDAAVPVATSAGEPQSDLERDENLVYWWEDEGTPPKQTAQFEGIDSRQIYLELQNKIKMNKFAVIEIPDNLMRIIKLLNTREFSYQEVEELFHRSGSLTGEVVKIANSAVYNRGGKVTRIRDGLTRLGPNKVKAVLYLHSSKENTCEDERFNDLARNVANHSYAVGQIASYLSPRFYPDPDTAFLTGLMHDIGKLGIIKEISEYYDIPQTGQEMTEGSFGEVIPMLHELAGRFIAKNWNMTEDISFAIENHHQPNHFLAQDVDRPDTDNSLKLTTLVHVSDLIAKYLGYGNPMGKLDFFNLPAVKHLGITDDDATKRILAGIPYLLESTMITAE